MTTTNGANATDPVDDTQHRRNAPPVGSYDSAPTNLSTDKVDRLEVIDETGRAYVKGSIYGTPVSVELSYQDEGRTLKVFVRERKTP